MRRIIPLIALALTVPAAAQQQRAPFTIAETGEGFATINDAVQSIRMGTATILIAPGVYHQCTVQQGGNITFKAVQPGTARRRSCCAASAPSSTVSFFAACRSATATAPGCAPKWAS
jgi:pectin methylesterase-like acyl-CoA thioesterase